MAAKLKNLKIRKVDFVDEGANPEADIKMKKRRDGEARDAGEGHRDDTGSILKKLFGAIGRVAGIDQSQIDSAVDEIQKGDSVSFGERMNEVNNRKIADEMWDICYALQSALCSILNDEDMDRNGTATAMQESLDEFYAVVQESISKWSGGKAASIVKKNEEVTEVDLEIMKAAVERLTESIEKAAKDIGSEEGSGEGEPDKQENPKGDGEEMKIDKSKLTDAERAFLESIEKRCGTNDGAALGDGGVAAPDPDDLAQSSVVNKSLAQPVDEPTQAVLDDLADGIYKGLHPAVRAELESLKKFRENVEEKELAEVAKRYAIIGKKEEELVPLFKSLKAAGGTAYNDMIAVLDQAAAAVEKSGVFSEIGKSGHGFGTVGATEEKVEAIAKGYMEKDASLDYASAVAKAWEDNPELVDEYETEAGF